MHLKKFIAFLLCFILILSVSASSLAAVSSGTVKSNCISSDNKIEKPLIKIPPIDKDLLIRIEKAGIPEGALYPGDPRLPEGVTLEENEVWIPANVPHPIHERAQQILEYQSNTYTTKAPSGYVYQGATYGNTLWEGLLVGTLMSLTGFIPGCGAVGFTLAVATGFFYTQTYSGYYWKFKYSKVPTPIGFMYDDWYQVDYYANNVDGDGIYAGTKKYYDSALLPQ